MSGWRYPSKPATLIHGSPAFRRVMADPTWLAEPKMDGARCLACCDDDGAVTLWSRHRRPILDAPSIVTALAGIMRPGAVLDGELLHVGAWASSPRYVAFDLLTTDGRWSADPLDDRRAALERALAGVGGGPVYLGEQVATEKDAALAAWLRRPGCEGIVLKHAASAACLDATKCRANPGWWRVKP